MPRWYEAAVESAFKPVAGGYIAKLPVRNLLGLTRSYVVNEVQKEEIVAVLRRQRLMLLCGGLICVGLGAALGFAAGTSRVAPGEALAVMAALLVVVVLVMAAGPAGYARHRLRPILNTLQPTEQSISFREQVEMVARRISAPVLVLGLISGILAVVGSIVTVMNAAYEQHPLGTVLVIKSFPVTFSLVLTAYFIWLIVLRMRMSRDASR